MRFPKTIRLGEKTEYANSERVFHLTIAAHPEISRFPPVIAEAIWASVLEQRAAGYVTLHAACLMPDHLHLLVSPGGRDILTFLGTWKSWTTRLARDAGHFGPLWQPGVWDRTCRNQEDFDQTAQYIIGNPVEAKLVDDERSWPHNWAWWFDDQPWVSPGSAPA